MLKPLNELYRTVRVLIGMYSLQILQGGGMYTAHTDLVHMSRLDVYGLSVDVWTRHDVT